MPGYWRKCRPSIRRPRNWNEQLRLRNRLNVHGDPLPAERDRMFDEGFSIGRYHLQIGEFCVRTDLGPEIPPQPLRPDIAAAVKEFVFAGLAIGALPAIADRAVEHL